MRSRPAHLAWVGMVYLAFVIYGSLVPLDFKPMPMADAVAVFRQTPFLQLGIGSRADWVANLLLFIPLTFFWSGALGHGRGLPARIVLSVFVVAVAVMLCIGIEFTQLFFPPRTVSQNDMLAETLGGLLGVAAWWAAGPRWVRWYQGWHQARAPSEFSQRLAGIYLLAVFAYGVLPLDLTLSGVEIFHKWREGKLNLLPFAGLPADPAYALYELATDVLLWLPLAFLWRLQPGRNSLKAWKMTFGAACLLEGLQLFVYSRSSDVTDLFTGAVGAALGVWLAVRSGSAGQMQRASSAQDATQSLRRIHDAFSWWPLAWAFAWLGALIVVFWYPFDFYTDSAYLRERLTFLSRVPFVAYYYGTEFRAITEVFHKTLFFAPLGALLAWFVAGTPWLWRIYAAFAAYMLLIGAPMLVEFGQMLLPDKHPDTTDWVLECLGGILGYIVFKRIRVALPQRQRLRPISPRSSAARR
ncbi:MAG: VanZ family protein [Pseudomonadota bacterium]|nr:VanZ family protein [Pseudomonadota bacterium]